MGIILKENNLIHTKIRHEKFLGSSRYRFDKGTNTIYLKEKLSPVIPLAKNEDIEEKDFSYEMKDYFKSDSLMGAFNREPLEPKQEETKKTKKTEYKLNKKKVREKCSAFFGLKQSRKFLAFYSISFPMGFPDDYAFKCFNTVLTRLRKNCGLRSYLWITERQKNGTIHFHMLTNNFMYVRKFNYYMAKAIETQIDKHNIDVNFDMLKYNGVDVRHVNNNKKALNCYLTKYVSKNTIIFYRLPYHSSHDISELFTAETFVNTDSSDFAPIKEALKHITTFVVDNEYCTIEYLCQKQENGKYFNPPDEWYWLRDFCNEQIYKNHYAKVKFKNMPLS
ncbi:rolling circle replication-associated protein [Dysgonomonas sp.]